jgi:hypothetical protein
MWTWRSNWRRARSDQYDHRLRGGRETRRQDSGERRGGECQGACELAGMIDAGLLEIPIAKVYRLADVQDATGISLGVYLR